MKNIKKLITLSLLMLCPLALFADDSGTLIADGNTDLSWTRGKRGTIEFSGDFGSGTITVLYLVGDTWVNFKDSAGANISYTDDNGFEFITGANQIRITLTGATAPDIDYNLVRER